MEVYIRTEEGAKVTIEDSTVVTLAEALDLVKEALQSVGYKIPKSATLEVKDGI